MKIKESKSIIIESDNAPLKISGRDGLSAYRVAKFHEKDNENIKHAVYRTPGGAYYNRYYVKDIYGDEDELGNKGVVGPFTSEEDAVARLKDYKKDVVKESYRGRRRIREGKASPSKSKESAKVRELIDIIEAPHGLAKRNGYRLLPDKLDIINGGQFKITKAQYNRLKELGYGTDESYKRRIRESKELDRKAFVSLVKLGRDPYDGYSILNDGYFVKRIYAESDEDAIRQFRDYLARKNEGLNRRRGIRESRGLRFVDNRKNAILGRGEDPGFDEYDCVDDECTYKTRKQANRYPVRKKQR